MTASFTGTFSPLFNPLAFEQQRNSVLQQEICDLRLKNAELERKLNGKLWECIALHECCERLMKLRGGEAITPAEKIHFALVLPQHVVDAHEGQLDKDAERVLDRMLSIAKLA